MRCLPLSASQSNELTNLIVRCQANPEDRKLYQEAHRWTQKLLYELPHYLHILEEDDCCEFLFYTYDAIDTYLSAFKKGRLSYCAYLGEVVRKRSRYFIYRRYEQQKKEKLVVENELYDQCLAQEEEMVAEHYDYTPLATLRLDTIETLPHLFALLVNNRKPSTEVVADGLMPLNQALKNPVNRKRFIILITLSPNLASEYLLEDLAAILEVDAVLLSRYLNTAGQMLAQKQQCKQDFETISNRHFRRLLEIEADIQREVDPEKLQKLEALRVWTQRIYKAKLQQIRRIEFHLSHRQLGLLLNIPKGTIDSSVHYMRRLLKQCMDEKPDNGYL